MLKSGPVIVAVAYVLLIGVLIWAIFNETSSFDDFSRYWGLFGTLVGVATGSIPSYFFKAHADQADQRADTERSRADEASRRAENQGNRAQLFAGLADHEAVRSAIAANPHLFEPQAQAQTGR